MPLISSGSRPRRTEPAAADLALGRLAEILGSDLTTAARACDTCGQVHPIGRHRVYQGAGVVLRCPNCDAVAAVVAEAAARVSVSFRGVWQLARQVDADHGPDVSQPEGRTAT
jgi:hypothetical protein